MFNNIKMCPGIVEWLGDIDFNFKFVVKGFFFVVLGLVFIFVSCYFKGKI